MVAPAVAKRSSLSEDLLRAMDRAKADSLVVYKLSATTLGIASAMGGELMVKPYVLTIVGEDAGEITCNCPAGLKGRACKHLSCGLMARKYHVYAKAPVAAPVATVRIGTRLDVATALDEIFS